MPRASRIRWYGACSCCCASCSVTRAREALPAIRLSRSRVSAVPTPARRVLFLLTEVFANGGIQRFNKTLLAAARDHGVSCDVLTLNDPALPAAPRCPDATAPGIFGRPAPLCARGRRARCGSGATTGSWSGTSISWAGSARCADAAPAAGGQVVLVAHGIEVWSGIGRGRRYALARAQRILCVSEYTRRRILEQAPGLEPGRLTLFPNALSEIWRSTPWRPSPRAACRGGSCSPSPAWRRATATRASSR